MYAVYYSHQDWSGKRWERIEFTEYSTLEEASDVLTIWARKYPSCAFTVRELGENA